MNAQFAFIFLFYLFFYLVTFSDKIFKTKYLMRRNRIVFNCIFLTEYLKINNITVAHRF